jgi:uncharacterized protein (TIGR02284 family)
MVTTVGTETHIVDLLSDLIQLDYDAADAYQAAIDRIGNPQFAAALSAFREDHLQHVAELSTILTAIGQMPPEQGDMKSLLTRGKVVLGGLIGDRAILEAIRTNEADTNTAYERAAARVDLDDVIRDVLQRALANERRHCKWVLSVLEVV